MGQAIPNTNPGGVPGALFKPAYQGSSCPAETSPPSAATSAVAPMMAMKASTVISGWSGSREADGVAGSDTSDLVTVTVTESPRAHAPNVESRGRQGFPYGHFTIGGM